MQIEQLEGLLSNKVLRNLPEWAIGEDVRQNEMEVPSLEASSWETSIENARWAQSLQDSITRTSPRQMTSYKLPPADILECFREGVQTWYSKLSDEEKRLPQGSKSRTKETVSSTLSDWAMWFFLTYRERNTTDRERLIAEIRGWALLESNWDGEGASAPVLSSLNEAEAFVRMISPDQPMPEPMLLPSGRAGLYWNDTGLYADLEFTGDGRIIYYIENENTGRHKGVAKFDSKEMPPVFAATILVKKSR